MQKGLVKIYQVSARQVMDNRHDQMCDQVRWTYPFVCASVGQDKQVRQQ